MSENTDKTNTSSGTPVSSTTATTADNEPKLLPPRILEKVKKWAKKDIEENNDMDKDTEEGGVKLDQGSDTEDGGVKL